MPTIRGRFSLRPRADEFHPCVWCEEPTEILMLTPGRPDLGQVPCHAGCAAAIIVAFESSIADASPDTIRRLDRLRQLNAGS